MSKAADPKAISKLREISCAGILDCKKALEETGGDMDKAMQILREKGAASAAKKTTRSAKSGVIASYIHNGDKIGVLLEINCETDFVARTEEFKNLVKEIGLQVAAANPLWVAPENVPKEIVEKEKEIYKNQVMLESKKPENIVAKIIEGKLEKYFTQVCLLEQPYIRDPQGKQKIKDLVSAVIAKTGENVVVKRFARFMLGEDI